MPVCKLLARKVLLSILAIVFGVPVAGYAAERLAIAASDSWISARNSSWQDRCRIADQPVRDRLLAAWILADTGGKTELVMSVRNTGSSPLRYFSVGGYPTDVLIQDDGGRPAALTNQGYDYFSQRIIEGSQSIESLNPGDCYGVSIDLNEYFDLRRDRTYFALAGVRFGMLPKPGIVAGPLQFEIGAPMKTENTQSVLGLGSRLTTMKEQLTDAEWTKLCTDSGMKKKHCVLQQILLPPSSGGPRIAISLTCVERISRDGPSLSRSEATSYRLSVRDAAGTGTTVDVLGSSHAGHTEPAESEQAFIAPRPGDAVGRILQLSDYKEFAKPGRYWIVAYLEDPRKKRCKWVSDPICVQIGK
jgi:hypothetical protein